MTNKRSIAADATFMIFYIGLSAAMVSVTMLLFALLALGHPFGPIEVAASAANLAGWIALPFAPRVYRSFVGHSFSWRSNGVLGGDVA